jgi:HEAT repeat protein
VNIRELAQAIVESAGTIAAGLPPRRRVEQSEIDLFASILLDAHESRWRRCHAAHRLGRAHDVRAHAPLLAGLRVDDENVRAAVFDSLRSSKFHFSDDTFAVFTEQLEAEIRGAEETLAALGALRGQAKCERLTAALEQEIYNGRERVQTLLSLASEDDSYDVLHYWWISNPTQQRPRPAQARLESSLKRIGDGVLIERTAALLAHSRPELLARAWGLQADVSLEARKLHLLEIAFNRSQWSRSWTRACAIEVMEEIRPDGCNALLKEASEDLDEMVRETAAWVLAKISADAPPSPIETARVS